MAQTEHSKFIPKAVVRFTVIVFLLHSFALGLDPAEKVTHFGRTVWQTENGLPQNTVHSIKQSLDGFIWIATEEGLARFDGINFLVFNKQNTPQFKSNYVRSISEDRQGDLWISTTAGLLRLSDGIFTAFTTNEGLPDNDVSFTYADRQGNLWVATGGDLSVYDQGKFVKKEIPSTGVIGALFEAGDGTLWIGTSDGLSGYKERQVISSAFESVLENKTVTAITQDEAGCLWVGSQNGLSCLLNGEVKTYSRKDGLLSDRINSLYHDREGILWVGTAGGLNRIKNGEVTAYTAKDGLSSNIVLSLLEDREGSLWVGTESGGLNVLKDRNIFTYGIKDGLTSDLIKSIAEDHSGNLWIGTYDGGLNRFSGGKVGSYTTQDGLASDVVMALCVDSQDNLWVGTPDGLSRFKDGKFTTYTSSDGLPNDFVRSIYEDHLGNLWIGTRGGLARFRDGVFTIFTTREGLSNDFIGTLIEDHDGNLWIGTLRGLNKYRDGRFTSYTTKDGLASEVITSIYEDGDADLWIGTNGGGLNRMRGEKFTAYSTAQGLYDDVIYRVLEDGQQRLWFSSNRGIFYVNKKELNDLASGTTVAVNSVSFGTADGMLTRECSGGGHPAAWKGNDGKLWFATIRGIAMIDPEHMKLNLQAPPVAIEEIKLDDQPVSLNRKAELPPGRSRLDFSYAGLSFIAPEKVQYKYRLTGFDRDWVEAGTRRVASYTNLAPGNYEFQVIARNKDGVWSSSAAKFGFYLRPYFYQTYWFYALCLLCLIILTWQIYRLRLKRVQMQFGAVLAERNRMAREIHDNLAQEILGISVQLEIVARVMPVSSEVAQTHLDRARLLVRNSIAEARRYVWDLRSQALENADLPTALSEAARRLTVDTGVQAQVEVSGTFRPMPQQTESNLLRIGQEAINNALKHANSKHISLVLQFEAKRVRFTIKDDGCGFVSSPAGNGNGEHFGLVGMRERTEQMGGSFQIVSTPGLGTEVVVDVPINA
jgi:ligand-binding sensor domain-containing protein/signal transduction histidine kinase